MNAADTPPPTDPPASDSDSEDKQSERPAAPSSAGNDEQPPAQQQQQQQQQQPPPMRAVPPASGNDDDEDEDEADDPAAQRDFEADPSLALPGVKEVERPGYRDPEWVNTEEREADRFEPIPTLVETPGGEAAADQDNDNNNAEQPSQDAGAATTTTPPAALEAGAAPDEAQDDEAVVAPQTPEQVAQVMEALLFVSAQPLSAQRLRELMELDSVVPIRQAAARLRDEYERRHRAFELVERAGGYLVQTRPEFSPFVKKLERERQATRISPAALTTLSIIAYRQPLTRAEIDAIRGVGSSHHIRALMERGLIKVVGRKSVPGNPSLYGTTNEFLLQFGLRSVRDLPQEADIEEVDEQTLRTQQQQQQPEQDDEPSDEATPSDEPQEEDVDSDDDNESGEEESNDESPRSEAE